MEAVKQKKDFQGNYERNGTKGKIVCKKADG